MAAHVIRVLIIGQAPGREGDPRYPLDPMRRGSGQMIRYLTGTTAEQFEALYERRNLLDTWPGRSGKKGDDFPSREARAAAVAMLPDLAGRRVVLLGRRVARAFGLGDVPWFRWIIFGGARVAVSPHTSGVNLWWNKISNRAEAARFFGSMTTGDRS